MEEADRRFKDMEHDLTWSDNPARLIYENVQVPVHQKEQPEVHSQHSQEVCDQARGPDQLPHEVQL
eukprot:1309231-Prorocentrum_lima.AAC.1